MEINNPYHSDHPEAMRPSLKTIYTLLLLCIYSFSASLYASDLAKEQRWASQVVDDLFDGEAIMLNDGENEFLALWTEASPSKEQAVIVMHGVGIHPDWPQVINPLRVGLPEQGWPTLSIQLPVLANEAEMSEYNGLMDEAASRIKAAVRQLKQYGYESVIIVAHSMGTRMAVYYLSQAEHPIQAFVSIGMNAGNEPSLKNIKIPMLDLYGKQDLEGVLNSASARASASAHNSRYEQEITPEATHFYDGFEAELIESVAAWIKRL